MASTSTSGRCDCPLPVSCDLSHAFGRTTVEPLTEVRDNLLRYGWSPVHVKLDQISKADTSQNHNACLLLQTLQQHELWNDKIVQLFPDEYRNHHQRTTGFPVSYRSSESGDPTVLEAKQSWELSSRHAKRENCAAPTTTSEEDHNNHPTLVQERMSEWMFVMHEIASTVRRVLRLPSNVLLCHEEDPDSTAAREVEEEPVDLLRAFYYDTVPEINNGSDCPTIMGSSPHTDWGSFTVVYQDTVGGLQTWCRTCHAWANVPTAASDPNTVSFVIHVGDITSLAINYALRQNQPVPETNTKDPVVFPSPKHRVLSPTTKKRVSLVYFAYPPPQSSIHSIAEHLEQSGWCHRIHKESPGSRAAGNTTSIPFDEYYLLRNQQNQNGSSEVVRSAEKQFNFIWDMELRAVLQDKWQQVQRA